MVEGRSTNPSSKSLILKEWTVYPRPGSVIELCPLEWFAVSAVLGGIPQLAPAKPV